MAPQRQLHLNAFIMPNGHNEAAWRHPRTDEHSVLDVRHFQNLGRIAERGKLDSVFSPTASPWERTSPATARPCSSR